MSLFDNETCQLTSVEDSQTHQQANQLMSHFGWPSNRIVFNPSSNNAYGPTLDILIVYNRKRRSESLIPVFLYPQCLSATAESKNQASGQLEVGIYKLGCPLYTTRKPRILQLLRSTSRTSVATSLS